MEFRPFSANETLMAETSRPPDRITGDYIKIGYLTTMFLIGAPINLAACFQLHDSRASARIGSEIQEFKKHLNFGDLMIFFVFVSSETCWLVAWEWRGGLILCKLVMFLRMLAFQISSNIVVCIALNRFLSIQPFCGQGNATKSHIRVKGLVAVAWLVAVLISVPQLSVWTVVEPFPTIKWHQCATIWEITRESQKPKSPSNATNSELEFSDLISEEMYNLIHLLCIFWIPLALICLSYISLVLQIHGQHKKTVRRLHFSLESAETGESFEEDPVTSSRRSKNRLHNAEKFTVRISLLLTTSYVIFWIPYNSLQLWKILARHQFETVSQEFDNLNSLVIFNSIINPFLYGMFDGLKKYQREG